MISKEGTGGLLVLSGSECRCVFCRLLSRELFERKTECNDKGLAVVGLKTRLEVCEVRIDYGMAVDRVFRGATFCRCKKGIPVIPRHWRPSPWLSTHELRVGDYWVSTHLRYIEGGEEA